MTKICSKCKEEKDISFFVSNKSYKDNYTAWCKKCHQINTKQWRFENPDKTRSSRILNKFKITLDAYNLLLEKQNYVCAVCGNPETIIKRGKLLNLSVDHDRSCCANDESCGSCVRGLLCQACNTGIGKLKDDINLLTSAITYLQNNKSLKGEK
jgi:hypothetical protein